MANARDALRDWHRLFGLLLTDFFTGLPFTVEVERDLSAQQQLLDVVIVRRGRGRVTIRLPDGLDTLAAHNLITFKSHREALDAWAIKELIGHSVAYRKLVSPSPSDLLPEEHFRLYAVCARFPSILSAQVPWQERQAGVYDCQWGTDTVRVIVAGQLSQEPQNAPLHLFSASPELLGFGRSAYQRRSANTSGLLVELFERFNAEGFAMSYTMEDFQRDFTRKHFARLTPEERRQVLQSLPLEERQEMWQSLTPAERREMWQSLTPVERREMWQSLPLEERQEMWQSLTPAERREMWQSLPPEEHRELLQSLPLEERLAGLSAEQIRQYLEQLTAGRPAKPRKPRSKR
jgi:predicted Fe-S protein YdhL (DUF1289 family)